MLVPAFSFNFKLLRATDLFHVGSTYELGTKEEVFSVCLLQIKQQHLVSFLEIALKILSCVFHLIYLDIS